MNLTLGFAKSTQQILIKELDWAQNQTSSKLIDVIDLAETHLHGLYIGNNEQFQSMAHLLEKEKNFYPILEASDQKLDYSSFENMGAHEFKELWLKIQNRWNTHNNLNSIENQTTWVNHLADLWQKDRMSFFEETWYWLKRNLAFTELTFVFNDIIQVKDEEKKDKPKLVQATLSGMKKAHFLSGAGKEKELMSHYMEKYHDHFEVTEFSPEKAQFVATAQIERSPIIIMGRTPSLTALQRSLLEGVFKGIALQLTPKTSK
jgi:hypothetical protein